MAVSQRKRRPSSPQTSLSNRSIQLKRRKRKGKTDMKLAWKIKSDVPRQSLAYKKRAKVCLTLSSPLSLSQRMAIISHPFLAAQKVSPLMRKIFLLKDKRQKKNRRTEGHLSLTDSKFNDCTERQTSNSTKKNKTRRQKWSSSAISFA